MKIFQNNKIDYLQELYKKIESYGFDRIQNNELTSIPKELFKESKFELVQYKNSRSNKIIQVYNSSLNTIHSIKLLDLNHKSPQNQYATNSLFIDLILITGETYFLDGYGSKDFKVKQFNKAIRILERCEEYLVTNKKISVEFDKKYPYLSNMTKIRDVLNSVLKNYDFELQLDCTRYNPYFRIPIFRYANTKYNIDFNRISSVDENFISGSISIDDKPKNYFFKFGDYVQGRAFNDSELRELKFELNERIRITIDNDGITPTW